MTLAETNALNASLDSMRSAFNADSELRDLIYQWKADITGNYLGGSRTTEYNAGQSPGGILITTVAGLPNAVGNNNLEAIVTDATVATNGGTVVGGGANRVMVRSNNTNWIIV